MRVVDLNYKKETNEIESQFLININNTGHDIELVIMYYIPINSLFGLSWPENKQTKDEERSIKHPGLNHPSGRLGVVSFRCIIQMYDPDVSS